MSSPNESSVTTWPGLNAGRPRNGHPSHLNASPKAHELHPPVLPSIVKSTSVMSVSENLIFSPNWRLASSRLACSRFSIWMASSVAERAILLRMLSCTDRCLRSSSSSFSLRPHVQSLQAFRLFLPVVVHCTGATKFSLKPRSALFSSSFSSMYKSPTSVSDSESSKNTSFVSFSLLWSTPSLSSSSNSDESVSVGGDASFLNSGNLLVGDLFRSRDLRGTATGTGFVDWGFCQLFSSSAITKPAIMASRAQSTGIKPVNWPPGISESYN
ncbi:hypothetical protein OGATHE_005708 [Ogataea polymorpha]|uniref:Uncharacterized protein n=1 Tax=Ogataea polymorpha TaxID=460523 RepID=A0A9P8NSL3_9ASCO|nr:hypothetical protein OGATHE_005708 [Ogataea polymorpha]